MKPHQVKMIFILCSENEPSLSILPVRKSYGRPAWNRPTRTGSHPLAMMWPKLSLRYHQSPPLSLPASSHHHIPPQPPHHLLEVETAATLIKSDDEPVHIIGAGGDPSAIDGKEGIGRGKGSALVPVDEWIILRQASSIKPS